MRVGVYVDGYNLYYGGRSLCGRGTAGWRWLDIRALATTLVGERVNWAGATIQRVVYCTARVDAIDNPSGHSDQDIYLRALDAANSVDHIEYGYYVSRVKTLPLAKRDAPIRQARSRVPVGTVNPSANQTAGALKDVPGNGAGRHFWRKLRADDFIRHQLPDLVAGYRLPQGW